MNCTCSGARLLEPQHSCWGCEASGACASPSGTTRLVTDLLLGHTRRWTCARLEGALDRRGWPLTGNGCASARAAGKGSHGLAIAARTLDEAEDERLV